MSENKVMSETTDKELSEIYKSITKQLNGLSASDAKTMLRKIELSINSTKSIVNFSPDYIDPYYEIVPRQ